MMMMMTTVLYYTAYHKSRICVYIKNIVLYGIVLLLLHLVTYTHVDRIDLSQQ